HGTDDVGVDSVIIEIPRGLVVVGDRRRVEQIIANLVENALRYGAPPGVVIAREANGEVVISVLDHAPGVPVPIVQDLLSKLTLTGIPRRSSPSTGLGLALARGLVEAMGG